MSAVDSLRPWMNFLKLDLFPQLHGHLLKSLAVMTLGMARSSHCHSTRVAQAATGTATVASARRRWERLLDNQHLDPQAMFQKFCQFLSGVWAGRRVVLIIDETDRDARLRSLRIGVGYRHRMPGLRL